MGIKDRGGDEDEDESWRWYMRLFVHVKRGDVWDKESWE